MGLRLFTAIVPPEAVIEELDDFWAPRREAGGPWRWTPASSWHLTTAFMADAAEHHLDTLVENLDAAAVRTPAFEISLSGGGTFPDPSRAKALWLGVATGAHELESLARRTRTAAERSGVRADGARFVPHLTLGRVNRAVEATKWLRVLDAAPPLSWRATDLQLIQSNLHDRGHRYEVLEAFALGG